MICAEIRLTPAMSTTEYIIAMSTAPTYGRVSPEARVETRDLRYPDRKCPHRLSDERRVARAAESEDAVEASFAVQHA